MALSENTKKLIKKRIELYEGRINHLYLDSKGRVTVGVGHLVKNKNSVSTIQLFKLKNGSLSTLATFPEKKSEYEVIAKLPYGNNHTFKTAKKVASLYMKDAEINRLLDKHVSSFHSELKNIYKTSNGYTSNFDDYHPNIQNALFDMIFNLGATKLVNVFKKFNKALKEGDWESAAKESNRPDVNFERNNYVKQLLLTAPAYEKEKIKEEQS